MCQPALRVGQRQELGWAATFLASPYGRFISGHTLVVDGANWQRRSLVNPPVVAIRDQMGRPPLRHRALTHPFSVRKASLSDAFRTQNGLSNRWSQSPRARR